MNGRFDQISAKKRKRIQRRKGKQKVRVGIVNFGMGNLTSVANAVTAVGGDAKVLNNPCEVQEISHLILPGVGAFGDAIAKLLKDGWVSELEKHALLDRKPFLGICLGMQLLASVGTEHGKFEGLGWIGGTVKRIGDTTLKVPHMGWNDVSFVKPSSLFNGISGNPDFYFVHSYAFWPDDYGVVTSWCDYGGRFAASLECGNIFATQFHPEKSQKNGLAVLRNFLSC